MVVIMKWIKSLKNDGNIHKIGAVYHNAKCENCGGQGLVLILMKNDDEMR